MHRAEIQSYLCKLVQSGVQSWNGFGESRTSRHGTKQRYLSDLQAIQPRPWSDDFTSTKNETLPASARPLEIPS